MEEWAVGHPMLPNCHASLGAEFLLMHSVCRDFTACSLDVFSAHSKVSQSCIRRSKQERRLSKHNSIIYNVIWRTENRQLNTTRLCLERVENCPVITQNSSNSRMQPWRFSMRGQCLEKSKTRPKTQLEFILWRSDSMNRNTKCRWNSRGLVCTAVP